MSTYRKPTTDNPEDFWFISQETWDRLLQESNSDNAKQKKNALNTLRKFDSAGRIMETDEGREATSPCSWCTRRTHTAPCRVFAKPNRNDAACAYCKRYSKSNCAAKVAAADEMSSNGDKVSSTRVEEMEAETRSLWSQAKALEKRLLAVETRVRDLGGYVDGRATGVENIAVNISRSELEDEVRIRSTYLSYSTK